MPFSMDSEEQVARYSRHILLPEVGGKGQHKIGEAKVLIVGAGGLGSPVALYLAAAGVGTIGLIDADVGRPKAQSAKETINGINPGVEVVLYNTRLTSENAIDIIKQYDIVVDGVDNFPTKFLINDACFFRKKPLVHGGILRFDGRVFTILPGKTACYRCVFKQPPPPGMIASCQEAGVIGALAGVIGTIQATEVLKLILGRGRLLTDRLLDYDARLTRFREIRISKNSKCPLCGEQPEITHLFEHEPEVCAVKTA